MRKEIMKNINQIHTYEISLSNHCSIFVVKIFMVAHSFLISFLSFHPLVSSSWTLSTNFYSEFLAVSSQLSIYQRVLLFPRKFGNSLYVSNFVFNHVPWREIFVSSFSLICHSSLSSCLNQVLIPFPLLKNYIFYSFCSIHTVDLTISLFWLS